MGAQLRFGTAGATGGGWSAQPGTLQPAFVEGRHEERWCWQCRSPRTRADRQAWSSRWPTMRVGTSMGADGAGTDATAARWAQFEPYSCDGDGCQTVKWILGRCVDASDVAIANATVRGFVAATNAYTGEGVSRLDGTYQVPTQNPGVAHYVVAYKAGSPDISGTSVNTLLPSNIDGT